MKISQTLVRKASCFFIITVCILQLVNLRFHLPFFHSILPHQNSIEFNTTFCLGLCAAALLFLSRNDIKYTEKLVAYFLTSLVLLIAALTLSQYIFGLDVGIDHFFYSTQDQSAATKFPGRMSVAATLLFMAFAFVLFTLHSRKYYFPIQVVLFAGIIFLGLISSGIVLRLHIEPVTVFPGKAFVNSVFMFLILFITAFFSDPLSHLQFSFQKKILGVFGMVFLFLIFLFFSFSSSNKRAAESAVWVAQTTEVVLLSEKIQALMGEIQAGVRGFFLTGDEDYLPLFKNGSDSMVIAVNRLRLLVKENPDQQKRIDTLQYSLESYIHNANKVVSEIIEKKEFSQSLQKTLNEGKGIMDKGRGIIIGLQLEEERLLNERKKDNKLKQAITGRSVLLFFIVISVLLFVAFFVIYHNVKARNKAADALRSSLNEISNFKTLFECAPGLYLILKPDFIIAAVSDEYLKATITRREEILGRGLFEVFPDNPDHLGADGVANLRASLNFVLKNKVSHAMANQKYDITGPDGNFEERIWAPLNKPVLNATGEVVFIIHSVEDITVRLRNENEIIRKTNETKDLYDNAPCGYHSLDENGYFVDINETELKWLGYQSHEMIGKLRFTDLLKNETKEFYNQHHAALIETGILNHVELDIVRRDGTLLPVIISATAIYDADGNYLRSRTTVIDYTERKKLNDQLHLFNKELEKRVELKTKEVIEKERQYRFLLENMREGIYIINFDWKFLFVNNAAVYKGKYSSDELLGHTMMEMYPELEQTEMFNELKRCMQERTASVFESDFYFPDNTQGWFELRIQPVPEGLFILSMDITERKRAQQEKEELLVSLEKKAAELQSSNIELERFAYVASHDLQEPLRMVSSFLSLLEQEMDGQLDVAQKEYIHFAVDGAERMKALVQALLQYSRIGTDKKSFALTDLNDSVQYVKQVLEEEIKKNEAVLNWKPLPKMVVHETLINQLFLNLVSNALKYRNKKNPEIEIGSTEEQDSYVFYVKDNGLGIEAKYYDKIFVIFQRLHNKSEYSGTGIGLAICKKIIELHNGKIWIESEVGKGSTFYFSIPKKIAL